MYNIETVKETKKNKSNFLYSFIFLSNEKKKALKTIYSFCRKTDDIVDNNQFNNDQKREKLKLWENELHRSLLNKSNNEFFKELRKVIYNYKIPFEYFNNLIKGVEMDLIKNRYNNFDELYDYCYNVASTVGLICINIFEYKFKQTKYFAINLGLALQLTNILRDLKQDASFGRIYLPMDDLKKFSYTEEELLKGEYNENFINLMKYESDKIRKFYKVAYKNLIKYEYDSMLPAIIMERIYNKLLNKMLKKNFNVFKYNIKISNLQKIFVAYYTYMYYRFYVKVIDLIRNVFKK